MGGVHSERLFQRGLLSAPPVVRRGAIGVISGEYALCRASPSLSLKRLVQLALHQILLLSGPEFTGHLPGASAHVNRFIKPGRSNSTEMNGHPQPRQLQAIVGHSTIGPSFRFEFKF